ncbi:MAG: CBS domain-containing protein, partial [Microcystis panniformis]
MVLMSLDTPLSWAPDLEKAINRQPLTVPPTTSLADAIAMIGQAHSRLCLLTDDLSPLAAPAGEVRVSCLLVVQGQELLGILTERDVVRLTAQGINLTETTVADVMVHPLITL